MHCSLQSVSKSTNKTLNLQDAIAQFRVHKHASELLLCCIGPNKSNLLSKNQSHRFWAIDNRNRTTGTFKMLIHKWKVQKYWICHSKNTNWLLLNRHVTWIPEHVFNSSRAPPPYPHPIHTPSLPEVFGIKVPWFIPDLCTTYGHDHDRGDYLQQWLSGCHQCCGLVSAHTALPVAA